MNYLAYFAGAFGVALTVAWFTHRFTSGRDKQSRTAAAADRFRATLLTTLRGIYPVVAAWHENIGEDLIATVPAVKTACAEFQPYVPRLRRRAFDKACLHYEQQCKQWHPSKMMLAHLLLPSEFPENPQIVFSQHVEKLLAFANKT